MQRGGVLNVGLRITIGKVNLCQPWKTFVVGLEYELPKGKNITESVLARKEVLTKMSGPRCH